MHDLRFALRQLGQSPGFSATVIVTLALGIGASTAMFSLVNAIVLRPLPFPESERQVQIWDHTNPETAIFPQGLAYRLWREQSTLLEGVALSNPVFRTLTGTRTPERLKGISISANTLRVLRMPPSFGTDFAPESELPGGPNHVVMLSHRRPSCWMRFRTP